MPDQSAEATLRYILESGISAVELMGGPIESLCARGPVTPSRRPRRRWRRRGGGRRGGRGGGAAAAAGGARRSCRPGARKGRGTAPCARSDSSVAPVAGGAARRRWRRRRGRGEVAAPNSRRRSRNRRRQGEGVAHQRLDGPLQEAAQDVQRRRRDHLRDQDAQRQHVGRGVRVRVQRRRGARRESHDARAADRALRR